jgi:hypothetical protein
MRSDQLRVVGLHRGRYHHHVGVLHARRIVTVSDLRAEPGQMARDRRLPEIRAADLVAQIQQHLGDAGHAGAADAEEMDAAHAAHRLIDQAVHAAASRQASAITSAALGQAALRAACAIASSC